MFEFNLMPLLCEAFGYNHKIYKGIDELYQSHKYECYQLAVTSKMYNYPLFKNGSLAQEEYCKKSLGLFLYELGHPEDEALTSSINKLIFRGWPYIFTFISDSTEEVSFDKYFERYIKKSGGITKLSCEELNANLAILLGTALRLQKTFQSDATLQDFLDYSQNRLDVCDHGSCYSLNKLKPEDYSRIRKFKKCLFNKIGEVKDHISLAHRFMDTDLYVPVELICKYDQFGIVSIFDGVVFTERDIDEIIYSYLSLYNIATDAINDEAINQYVINYYVHAIIIRYFVKAYRLVKEYYFKNNKETMYLENEKIERDLKQAKSEIEFYKNHLNQVNAQLADAENHQKKLAVKLEMESQKDNELNSLRELMFNLDQEIKYDESQSIDLNLIKGIRAVVIGGHERWQAKMKELLPEYSFIHKDMVNFDTSLIENAEVVFFYVNYLSHAIYYKTINCLHGKNVRIHYLAMQNDNLVLQDMFRFLTTK